MAKAPKKPRKAPLIKKDGTPSKQGQGGGPTPIKLTDEQRAELVPLSAVLTLDQIADYFGIAHSTFDAILARDEEVSRLYKKGRAKAVAVIGGSVISKARKGDNQSMFFYLKTQAGWRETDRSNAEGGEQKAADALRALADSLNG